MATPLFTVKRGSRMRSVEVDNGRRQYTNITLCISNKQTSTKIIGDVIYIEFYVSPWLIIDVIGVIRMSMQSFTRLVGIGSKSEDLHGAVGQDGAPHWQRYNLRFCRTFLVSGGFNTRECESKGKEERMTEILLMKNELKVFAKVAIEEWPGKCIIIIWHLQFPPFRQYCATAVSYDMKGHI